MGRWTAVGALCLVVTACASSTEIEFCDGALPLDFGSCLRLPASAELDSQPAAVLRSEIERTLLEVNGIMPITAVEIDVLADPVRVIPEVGMGGFAVSGGHVQLFVDPSRPQLEALFRREVRPMLAHELHHAKRMRHVGYGPSLFQAAITEGLADHFSIELTGIDPPPWSVALIGPELDNWTGRLLEESSTDYNHSQWFLGASPDIPRWTGYAVGFRLVGQFLEANPGRRPSDLFDEPAGSFEPPLGILTGASN